MNNIEKLELKHICGYLPYGLHGIIKTKGDSFEVELKSLHQYSIQTSPQIHGYKYCQFTDIKLLLLPLSALTEPLEDGTVPIVELAKMSNNNNSDCKYAYELKKQGVVVNYIEDGNAYVCDYFNYDENGFYIFSDNYKFSHDYASSSKEYCRNQLQLFEYLFAHHFDIYGLIPANLAIDKRTVKL